MKREIVKIDRELCNGCGLCIPNCHEGALQIIDDKAVLVSELMCDGLGACLGHCPMGAITIETREAAPYDEVLVIQEMIPQGKNVIIAHLKHLKEHQQTDFLKQAVKYLNQQTHTLPFDLKEVIEKVHNLAPITAMNHEKEEKKACGCPGGKTIVFEDKDTNEPESNVVQKSQLKQWPVQLHLVNPLAPYFKSADVVLAADCVAFALGDFHQTYLKGKSLAIACPKLDDGQDSYLMKLVSMINDSQINTLTVMIMEVPCCGGLLSMAKKAVQLAKRKIPVKAIVVGLQGNIVSEEWV